MLGTYALMGSLIGLGASRELLRTQLLLNGVNVVLDVLFAGVLGWGAKGIALGTALAEWTAVIYAGWLVYRLLRARRTDTAPFWPWARIRDRDRLYHTLGANSDILVRTRFCCSPSPGSPIRARRFGDAVLGANHVLLQLVSFSAFFLDGYAFVAESLVGEAVGARQRARLVLAVRRSTRLAGVTAAALALAIAVFGALLIGRLTDIGAVRATAVDALPWAALYVLCSFPAFQLDGIFIGATRTREMRNASLLSALAFLLAWWLLAPRFGNDGLWWAFITFVVMRALALLIYYPRLLRGAEPRPAQPALD